MTLPPDRPPVKDRPTKADWLTALPHLQRRGGEYVGPCPVCGGNDRFRVNAKGAFCRKNGCSLPDLLKAAGLHTGGNGTGGGHWFDRAQAALQPPDPAPSTLAADLWAACVAADGTPAHAYLWDRRVWPGPHLDGMPALPGTVGWLDAASTVTGWSGLPGGAAGAVAFRYDTDAALAVAVSLEALTASGNRLHERWRRTFGKRQGGHFVARPLTTDSLVVCEGEVTALACCWLHPGAGVWALGGTGGLAAFDSPKGACVLVEVDGDGAGIKAARDLRKRGVATRQNPAAEDAADVWAATLLERAAILEYEGGLERAEADRVAWTLAIGGDL